MGCINAYRHYLDELFCQRGITDYTEQCRALSEILQCKRSHARRIMNGNRDLSGTRTGTGLNKYAALARYFSITVDELVKLDTDFRLARDLSVK